MLITVAGKQVETGEALKTHVSDGVTVITAKYFDQLYTTNPTPHLLNLSYKSLFG